MRALAVALLLSVPLSASDKAPLEKAVELFRSQDAGQRAAGSQLAERELRKLLAPLLKAMKDDDPEVRRRARRSILSLVPEEPEPYEAPQTEEQIMTAIRTLLKQRQVLRAQRRAPRAQRRQKLEQKTRRLLADFGVRGTKWLPRKAGFIVQHVKECSPADRLGLRKGDVILQVNGRAVTESRDFLGALGDKPDWTRITVMRLRDGQLVRLPKK